MGGQTPEAGAQSPEEIVKLIERRIGRALKSKEESLKREVYDLAGEIFSKNTAIELCDIPHEHTSSELLRVITGKSRASGVLKNVREYVELLRPGCEVISFLSKDEEKNKIVLIVSIHTKRVKGKE